MLPATTPETVGSLNHDAFEAEHGGESNHTSADKEESVRSAFIQRATRAMLLLATKSTAADLRTALSKETDLEAVIIALESKLDLLMESDEDPLRSARLRGFRMKRQLLEKGGGTMSTAEVAKLLGLTPQAVHKRRRARKLLAVKVGTRSLAHPVWQFGGEDGVLNGLEDVLTSLDETLGPWMTLAFFLNENSALGEGTTPLEALRRGDVAQALRAARMYGEHGAQ